LTQSTDIISPIGSIRKVPNRDIGSPILSHDRGLVNPITGIAICCARAESAHAAAPAE
jgi:hypothetical protein